MKVSEICTIAISVCALVISIYTVYIQKKLEEKSVRPLAFLVEKYYQNFISVGIRNCGNGALIIKDFKVIKGNDIKPTLIEFMPIVDQKWDGYSVSLINRPICQNQEVNLLSITTVDSGINSIIRDSLIGVKIKMKYSDVYDKLYNITMVIKYNNWAEDSKYIVK